MSYRTPDQHAATIRLLLIAEHLYDAVASRNAALVEALLETRAATSLPRDVREEALAVVALPPSSYRVPMALLRYHHRLGELARADGDDEWVPHRALDREIAHDEELTMDDGLADAPPRPDPAQMEIPFGVARPRWGRASSRSEAG